MPEITIYSTKICPNCQILKQILKDSEIPYDEMDMNTPAALTELTMNSVFTMSAPVLQIRNRFYTTSDMFSGDTIDRRKVEDIIAGI